MFKRKGRLSFSVVSLLILFQLGCATQPKQFTKKWTHLELGAGNYGADGHTKTSLKKTVLMALKFVSTQPNFIDQLPDRDAKEYRPEDQYQVLFWTLDQLVKREGNVGVFHVNDLVKDYADFASEKLKAYAKKKGYDLVQIESVPGDYSQIDPSKTLLNLNRRTYDSVHLKNPEVSFYHHGMDGNKMITDQETRNKTRNLLQTLANLGSRGMYFFPIDVQNYFIPLDEKDEFINKGIFYKATTDWEPVPYVFPTGEVIPKQLGKIYFIEAR